MQDATNTSAGTGPIHPLGPGFESTLKDMRFIGWVAMIKGILACLSIFGALLGVPLIIAAHRFIEGVNRFEMYRQAAGESELAAGFYELGRSFRILKILVVIYLVLALGSIAFMFLMGGLGLLAGLAEGGY